VPFMEPRGAGAVDDNIAWQFLRSLRMIYLGCCVFGLFFQRPSGGRLAKSLRDDCGRASC
jgi:hypothetical protein